jgi:hypothetical protein
MKLVKSHPLVGTWKLKSFEMKAPDGSALYPFGKDALGYLVFSPEGYLTAMISAANRKNFASQDPMRASSEEKVSAEESFLSYCGPCEVEKDKWRTKVEVSLVPNWVGGYEERHYETDGKTLSVRSTPMLLGGKEVVGHLTFERV